MSTSFGTKTETLLLLALLSNDKSMPEVVVQKEHLPHGRYGDPEVVIRRCLSDAFSPLLGSVYAPVYKQLFEDELKQIDYTYVAWALRGEHGVYFRAPEGEDGADEPTARFLAAVASHDGAEKLRWLMDGCDDDAVTNTLRAYFAAGSPGRLPQCPLLISVVLDVALSRINWTRVARCVMQTGPLLEEKEC